jgi:cold shock protein
VEAPEMNFVATLGEETQMAQSTVTLFNDIKRLDFFEQENSKGAFVYLSANTGNGFKSQTEGDRIIFEITITPKGLQAANLNKM